MKKHMWIIIQRGTESQGLPGLISGRTERDKCGWEDSKLNRMAKLNREHKRGISNVSKGSACPAAGTVVAFRMPQ